MIRKTASALALALLVLPGAATAASTDPDWPCVQVRNPEISAAAVWSGPEIKPEWSQWWEEQDVASAARTIASRRTSMDEAQALIDKIAAAPGDKTKRLTQLFLGMLDGINVERGRVMNGLVRYARKQRSYADRLEQVGDRIAALQAGKTVEGVSASDLPRLEEQMKWDLRVFEERNQSLSYVCESPQLLEQRAFELSRMIQEKL